MQRYSMDYYYVFDDEIVLEMENDSNGDYVLHSEAQAEIERLEKEVASMKVDRDVHEAFAEIAQHQTDFYAGKLDTAWNDAIEAAAIVGQDVAGGLTGACIRALKRPTP